MNSGTKKGLIAAGVVAALGAGGAAIAIGSSGTGDDEGTQRAITGEALQKASDAALAHTGGGKVTETEVNDEESYYQVEVTTDKGQQDVQLDRNFNVVSSKDDSGSGENEGANESDSGEHEGVNDSDSGMNED
jgi:uncharacterized membrane protein YkoI